jgi:hypothetical protein
MMEVEDVRKTTNGEPWPKGSFFINMGCMDGPDCPMITGSIPAQTTKMKPVDIGGHLKKPVSKGQQKDPTEMVGGEGRRHET